MIPARAHASQRDPPLDVKRTLGTVSPSDIRMLRELAKESRLMAIAAFPDRESVVHRYRSRVGIRGTFVVEAKTHLWLLQDLAAIVEARLEVGSTDPSQLLGETEASRVDERQLSGSVALGRPRQILSLEAPLPQRPGELATTWRERAIARVQPGDVRMLGQLALVARHAVEKARPGALPQWCRLAFLEDAIRHLELLDELARLVESKLWDE